ncbi:NAD(P)-dependent oxidoreductase [Chitinophaga flava]|uniref:3-hydroxyisobutyrate dehydrogenase n=1 Tax=Chitinophaga flava TaxID=2259036 RepID=A0A365XVE1_9BACT|nr:NAD(P)-binding domain-containing protein [Chitinophaga flava]RBL90337.1 3-hydroxyisobutyrate dehydrogenase [Chitinophaga flava]
MQTKTTNKVTVIGLGMMGSTLAQLLLNSGHAVTIWNRSSNKAAALIEQGAVLAGSPQEAVAASPLVIICVMGYTATMDILNTPAVAAALAGKTVIQLSSTSPNEAQQTADWTIAQGAIYLDGAIQAAPSQMGRPDTPIFFSGDQQAYEEYNDILRVFGGGLTYLGTKASQASAVDLATLSYIYGSVLGFFHGARIMEAAGLSVDDYSTLVAGITPSFGDFLQHEGKMIHRNDFSISESPLSISIEAVGRILQQAREAGINDSFPQYANNVMQQGAAAGYAGEELAALIKVLRQQ